VHQNNHLCTDSKVTFTVDVAMECNSCSVCC